MDETNHWSFIPDIQYAVNYLARFLLTTHDEIIKEAERILKYLLSTKELKIMC